MSTINNNRIIKNEKRSAPPTTSTPASSDDHQYDEWARTLVNRPIPQIGNSGQIQQGTLNNFIIQSGNSQNSNSSSNAGTDGLRQHNGYDIDSAIGRFSWETIGDDKHVPCVFRCGEKFCCVRMAEVSVFGDFLRLLPVEMFDCVNITSYCLTTVEAYLLNYVNTWHCDGFYGTEPFTVKDQLIGLEDVDKFYEFLLFAFNVLNGGGRNDSKDYSRCAFIKVNSDNLIPYTVLKEGEKGVPLFYFEGQTSILKEKAVPLAGWELAYLKVCCRVQGVRKDLIAGSTLQIVKVSDLRAYFPKRTVFTEEFWPEPRSKSLLSSKVNGTSLQNTLTLPLPSCEKWCKTKVYSNPAAPPATLSPVAGNLASLVSSAVQGTSTTATTVSTLTSSNASIQNPTAQSSVISLRNGGVISNSNSAMGVRVANGVTPQSIPTNMQAHSKDLVKVKVPAPPQGQDIGRLSSIPEYSENKEGAFTVRWIKIEKELMHCINMVPHRQEIYLVVLKQFMDKFFPSVSIYPTALSVLKSCGVQTYLPNQAQIRTLNAFGFNIKHPWEFPLIPAVGASQAMTRLRAVFRPREAAASLIQNSGPRNGYVQAIR